jgi:methionyl-tRNA formyltransferase
MDRLAARVRRNGIVRTFSNVVRKLTSPRMPVPRAEAAARDILGYCEAEGIRVVHVAALSLPESVAAVRALEPDLLIHAGAGILRRELLATPRLGTLNAHMGLLPRYRGMNVAEWARLQSNPVGCTAHLIDEGIDTGDILVVSEIDTKGAASVEALRDLVDKAQIELLARVVRFVVATGELPPRRPQRADEGRQYFRMHAELKALLCDVLAAESAGGAADGAN